MYLLEIFFYRFDKILLKSRQTTPESEENPIALLQSMTASSCSASLSSKHSRMSTSAMSVIAATLTSHAEVSRGFR